MEPAWSPQGAGVETKEQSVHEPPSPPRYDVPGEDVAGRDGSAYDGLGYDGPSYEGLAACLVVVHGDQPGRRLDLPLEPVTFGRDGAAEIVLDSEHVSREHARIERDGVSRYLQDLDSTNGTYVNDKPITRHRLRSGDLLQVGEMLFRYLAGSELDALYFEEVHLLALHDGLTGVANARAADEFLEREFARSRRHGRDLALLMADLDDFKTVNERLGHVAGDAVLRAFAQLVSRRIRKDELLARYGDDEFVIVLPESTLDGATAYAEILREMIEAHHFDVDGATVQLTLTVGVAAFDPHMVTAHDVLRAADAKLYSAKQVGYNRVVV